MHVGTLAAVDEALRCYRHPDRETYVSCSECGRGICPDCMTYGPVGIRCPDHARTGGKAAAPKRVARTATRSVSLSGPIVTLTLIGINVGVYLLELLMGAGLNAQSGWIYEHGVLVSSAVDSAGQVVGVSEGEWWRLITASFLHYGPLHLGLNMLVLWFIGPPLEEYFGHWRYLLVYLVSGLAGSAGALLWSPNALTVGASGAIFGLMGALLVVAVKLRSNVQSLLGLLAVNAVITVVGAGYISWQGHLGGFLGGVLLALALVYAPKRRRSLWQGLGLATVAAVIVVGVVLRTLALA